MRIAFLPWLLFLFAAHVPVVRGQAVINEVMWAGSDLSTADEWLEIASPDGLEISLANWTITSVKDGLEQEMLRFPEGTVLKASEFFVVSNYPAAQSRLAIEPNLVVSSLALSNTKLLLRLRDASGQLMDEVDDGVGAPLAGGNDATAKASMSRIDMRQSGTLKENWRTADTAYGWDEGAPIFGTPGLTNGQSVIPISSSSVAPASSSSASSFPIAQVHAIECYPVDSQSVVISELLPDPDGDDASSEWIELQNIGLVPVSLCGWQIDDAEGGSDPFSLDAFSIGAGEYLLLHRSLTKIALNNSDESVRLVHPDGTQDIVSFDRAKSGQSYTRINEGSFIWTDRLTPGYPNRAEVEEVQRSGQVAVGVYAVMPNPVGPDSGAEWIELKNYTNLSIRLDEWMLDNSSDGDEPFVLDGVTLEAGEIRRFTGRETGIALVNDDDSARLVNPDGEIISFLRWEDAGDAQIFRPFHTVLERVHAQVIKVVDGDTVDIVLTHSEELERMPDSLQRRWLSVQNEFRPSIRVRLIGVDTPETVHPTKNEEAYGKEASDYMKSLLKGKNVELEFDHDLWDKYSRLLAYVFTEDGQLVQQLLLEQGYAKAYLSFPFGRSDMFEHFESLAQGKRRGVWESWVPEKLIQSEVSFADTTSVPSITSSMSFAQSSYSPDGSSTVPKIPQSVPLAWMPVRYVNVLSSDHKEETASGTIPEEISRLRYVGGSESPTSPLAPTKADVGIGRNELIAISLMIFGSIRLSKAFV